MRDKAKRILFIELEDKTSAIHLLPVLRQLRKNKEAKIILLGEQDTYLTRESKKLKIPTYVIRHAEFNIHELKTYIPFVRTVSLIGSIIRKHNIQIIHCHRLNWAYLGIVASLLWNTKLYIDIVYLEKLTSTIQRLLLKMYSRAVYLPVSEFAKRKFLTYYPFVSPHKVAVFCGGIDLPKAGKRRPGREPLRDWRGKKIIAMVSRLTPEKGVDIFIEAAGILSKMRKDTRFVFIGRQKNRIWKVNYHEECLKRIHNLGLGDRFRIVDFTYDMQSYYPAIYCSVLPTLRDALAYVSLESLSYKKPVIITDVDGAPETVNYGKAGILIPTPPSPVILARKIDMLLQDEKLHRAYAQAGYEWVKKNYNSRTKVSQLSRIYNSALGVHA